MDGWTDRQMDGQMSRDHTAIPITLFPEKHSKLASSSGKTGVPLQFFKACRVEGCLENFSPHSILTFLPFLRNILQCWRKKVETHSVWKVSMPTCIKNKKRVIEHLGVA